MTCHQALKQYRARGLRFCSGRKNNRAPEYLAKITPEIKEYLLKKETLQRWSGFSLSQRAAQLMSDMGVSVTGQALYAFYKRHSIKFYAVSTVYHAAFKKTFVEQRLQFAAKLTQMIFEKRSIVYFDESSFNSWMRPSHTWSTKQDPVKMVINENRFGGVTVYGAISPFLRRFVYMLGASTTKEQVCVFLQEIRNACSLQKGSHLHIVLDNYRSHMSSIVKE